MAWRTNRRTGGIFPVSEERRFLQRLLRKYARGVRTGKVLIVVEHGGVEDTKVVPLTLLEVARDHLMQPHPPSYEYVAKKYFLTEKESRDPVKVEKATNRLKFLLSLSKARGLLEYTPEHGNEKLGAEGAGEKDNPSFDVTEGEIIRGGALIFPNVHGLPSVAETQIEAAEKREIRSKWTPNRKKAEARKAMIRRARKAVSTGRITPEELFEIEMGERTLSEVAPRRRKPQIADTKFESVSESEWNPEPQIVYAPNRSEYEEKRDVEVI